MFIQIKKICRTVILCLGIVTLTMHDGTGVNKSVWEKMDPVLCEMVTINETERTVWSSSQYENWDHELRVEVFVQTTDPEILKRKVVSVRSVIGDIVTAVLPLSRIRSIAELTEVSFMEASSVCRPLLDMSIPEINVDQVWNGDLGTVYRGEGVIVGIYDSGIDWSHPDFIDEGDTTSRVLYLWDQTVESGPHPDGYAYGTEYTQAEINDEIDGTPEGIVQGRDSTGHGTHVAGIAAGNGRAGGNGQPTYIGVAPEADLIVVKGGNETGFTEARIIHGIDYIFKKAEAMNPPRPAVVNLSVGGTQRGPHDGTSSFETGLDNLLDGKTGRAVVVAAGNDGDQAIHFKDNFSPPSDSHIVEFQVDFTRSGLEDYVAFDIWCHNQVNLSATLITPEDSVYGPFHSVQNKIYKTVWGRIDVIVINYTSREETNIHLRISDRISEGELTDHLTLGSWKLVLSGSAGPVEGWLYDSSMGAQITSDVDYSTLINEPGNARFCITVGSYISRLEWPHQPSKAGMIDDFQIGALSDFSSPGPKRNSPMEKPDIVAPGESIVSAYSSDVDPGPGPDSITPDGQYRAWKGTSMAAPHVTGVIALMFQIDPELDVSDIKNIFISTSRKDEFTGEEAWNPKWGYGKLDAYGALQKTTSVQEGGGSLLPESIALSQNYPNPFNGSTVITYTIPGQYEGPVTLELFDMTGRKVRTLVQEMQTSGQHEIIWEGRDDQGLQVGSGVYVYQLRVDQTLMSKRLIYLR
ncbi:S8 family serine peptidase [bacterium]|nr:S8 family serine peptidase [bacterium]